MTLLEQIYQWTPTDSNTDVSFTFVCPCEVSELVVYFGFSPVMEWSNEQCIPQIEAALTRYYDCYSRALQPMKAEQFLPVKNLITVSLKQEEQYLGNAHRWAGRQVHHITTKTASPGFIIPTQLEGNWSGMLHLHEIISPCCTAVLQIEGRMHR